MTNTQNSHTVVIVKFTEADLIKLLDSLDDTYPVQRGLTYGELEELGTWVKDLYPEILDLIRIKAMMFLETIEGREELGQR